MLFSSSIADPPTRATWQRFRREVDVDRLHFLIDTQRLINSVTSDVDRAVEIALRRAQEITGAESVALQVIEHDGLVLRAGIGPLPVPMGTKVPCEEGLAGLCLQTGLPLLCHDTRADLRVGVDAHLSSDVRSLLAVPLRASGHCLGVLSLHSAEEGHFTDADADVLEILSTSLAAPLVMASRLENEAERALRDPLTGLASKMILLDRLTHCAYEAGRYGRPFGLFFIDVDRFTAVNDQLGREWGDAVLRSVAASLEAALRAGDTIARIDSDHFVVLCENAERPVVEPLVRGRIEEVFATVNDELRLAGYELRATVGVAWSAGDYESAAELLDAAGVAVRRAKEATRPAGS